MSPDYVPLPWTRLKVLAKERGLGHRPLYKAAADGRLKAKRINLRGDWFSLPEWLDEYLLSLPDGAGTRTASTGRRRSSASTVVSEAA